MRDIAGWGLMCYLAASTVAEERAPAHIAQVIRGHRDFNVTMGGKNYRELHQTGENPQVA